MRRNAGFQVNIAEHGCLESHFAAHSYCSSKFVLCIIPYQGFFNSLLDKIESLLVLTDAVKEFSAASINEFEGNENLVNLNKMSKENRSNLPVLNGTLLLYVSGQFESFVKLTFEELCTNISQKAEKFSHLPKEMRENLIKYTA